MAAASISLDTVIRRLTATDREYLKTVASYRAALRTSLETKKRKRARRAEMVGNNVDSALLPPIRWDIVKIWAGRWLLAIGVGKKLWESPTMKHVTQRDLLEFAIELKEPVYAQDIRGPLVSLMNKKLNNLNLTRSKRNVKKLFSDFTGFRRTDFIRFYSLIRNSNYSPTHLTYPPEYLDAVRIAWGALNAESKTNFAKALGVPPKNPKIVPDAAKMFWESSGSESTPTEKDILSERGIIKPPKQDHEFNPSIIDIGEIDALINKTNYDDWVVAKMETLRKELEQLNSLIGMPLVKNEIAKIVSSFIVTGNINTFQNAVLQGPPGTGKTLFAVSIARVFASLGIVINSKFNSLTRQNFVQGFEGQTASATNQVLLNLAFEGTIFIDEAPTIARGPFDSFGLEALQAIMGFITKYEGESVIIIAGYARALDETFFSLDEGLARRFPRRMIFNGYSITEMLQIGYFQYVQMTQGSASNASAPKLTKAALNRIGMWVEANLTTYKEDDPMELQISQSHTLFGNYGGDMRSFIASIIEAYSHRVFSLPPKSFEISTEDVNAAGNDMIRKKKAEWSAHLQSLQETPKYNPEFNEPSVGVNAVVATAVSQINFDSVKKFFTAATSLSEAVVWYNGDASYGGGTSSDEPVMNYDEDDIVEKTTIRSSSSTGTSEMTDDEGDTTDDSYTPETPKLPPRSDSAGRTRSSKRNR